MTNDKLNIFNYKTLNNFLIFLLISILFSTIVKLTKVHTQSISYKINLVDIPDNKICLLYTSPSPRDVEESRMPSSA